MMDMSLGYERIVSPRIRCTFQSSNRRAVYGRHGVGACVLNLLYRMVACFIG
jgi:hypothetical protein